MINCFYIKISFFIAYRSIKTNPSIKVMILFYSNYCLHCRMLLETIERHDKQKIIKLASIEDIKATRNKIPPQITHVPALMLLPEKKILFGKQVFDYLLLPNQGILMLSQKATVEAPQINSAEYEPEAFSMLNNTGLSDSFSMIDSEDRLSDRTYSWTMINEEIPPLKPMTNDTTMNEDTRTKKSLDLDAYKIQRDLELKQIDVNTNQMPTAEMTR